jgi:FimV-like protein
MKKLMLFNQATLAVLLSAGLASVAWAEEKSVEVKPGNVLGKIIAEHYPDYPNRQAIMQEVLTRNPEAFSNKNVNSLIVGKTIKLPDAKDIPNLQPPAPKPVAGADPALQAKITALETEVTELKDTVALLEDENAGLQETLKGYVEAPTPDTGAIEALQKQVDTSKQALDDSEKAQRALEEQLATAKRDNETLQNDLQQIRAAATLAENNAASTGNMPWILLGLLALLALPLIWLLRRKREFAPLVATQTAAPVTPVAVDEDLSSFMPDLPPAPAVSSEAGVVMPVMPALADENPDAALKLDIARAYLDLRDSEAAADILQDVLAEGGEQQRQEAREILSFIT